MPRRGAHPTLMLMMSESCRCAEQFWSPRRSSNSVSLRQKVDYVEHAGRPCRCVWRARHGIQEMHCGSRCTGAVDVQSSLCAYASWTERIACCPQVPLEFSLPTWVIPGADIFFLGCELLGTTLKKLFSAEHGTFCAYEAAELCFIFGLHSSLCLFCGLLRTS